MAEKKMAEKKGKKSFEEAIRRLEEIVKTLESGNATLSDSLALFEEGIGLAARCNELLVNAEQRVNQLIKGVDGEMTEAPLEEDELR